MKVYKSASCVGAVVASCSLALGIGGCDDASTTDSPEGQQVQLSGTVVDGYIVGARVWLDINGNLEVDSFEPTARTDRYGFFSHRPELVDGGGDSIAEERDYCDSSQNYYDEGRYCLEVADTTGEGTLRMLGGYDVLTGERFSGSMSRKIEVLPSVGGRDLAITPLTSILVGTNDNIHHIDAWGGDIWGRESDTAVGGYVWQLDVDADEVATALRLHKVVDVITTGILDLLSSEYGVSVDSAIIQDLYGVDPAMEVYRALRSELEDNQVSGSIDNLSLSRAQIKASITALLDTLDAREDITLDDEGAWKDKLAQLATDIHDAIGDGLSTAAVAAEGSSPMYSGARAVEVATFVAREDAQYSKLTSSAGATSIASNSDYYEEIITGVREALDDLEDGEGSELDVGGLAELLNNDLDMDMSTAVEESLVEIDLPELTGTVLRLNVQPSGADEDSGEAAIAFYFEPDQGVGGAEQSGWFRNSGDGYLDSGQLTACIASSGDIDFPFEGDVVHRVGTWERLSDRSLLLNMDFAGQSQTLNLRVRGSSNAAALKQYYSRGEWDVAGNDWREWTLQDAPSDEPIKRGDFWQKFSADYWSGTDASYNSQFLGDSPDQRFDVYDDDLAGKDRSNNWQAEDLTPRGWVVDLDYEGDKDLWDVERRRDGLMEGMEDDADAVLKLFVPYSSVPAQRSECFGVAGN